jgi:hypothetical protein
MTSAAATRIMSDVARCVKAAKRKTRSSVSSVVTGNEDTKGNGAREPGPALVTVARSGGGGSSVEGRTA